jgi:hypothetical protein
MFLFVTRAYSQQAHEETLSGPDSHETGQGPHGHLFGDWGGERTRLLERGVSFDFNTSAIPSGTSRASSLSDLRVGIDFGEPLTWIWERSWANMECISMRQRCGREGAILDPTSVYYQSQRPGQREYMSPRFMVDREAMAERTPYGTRGSVCGSGFLWGPALCSVFHLRANGLCVGQSVHNR